MSTSYFHASDNTLIHNGTTIQMKKCYYTAHATTIYSVEHAIQILDEIGQKYDSDDTLPFALRLIEGTELIQLNDDNGEFGASSVILNCLSKLDGYNVLVCVSRRISGAFLSEMHQGRKLPVIRTATNSAVDMLKSYLLGKINPDVEKEPVTEVPEKSKNSKLNSNKSQKDNKNDEIDMDENSSVITHTQVEYANIRLHSSNSKNQQLKTLEIQGHVRSNSSGNKSIATRKQLPPRSKGNVRSNSPVVSLNSKSLKTKTSLGIR